MPSDTLKNENFKPHAALKSLLEWLTKHGGAQPMRNAASRALVDLQQLGRQQSERPFSSCRCSRRSGAMKQLLDTVWQRRGVSWIWDDEALQSVAKPSEVLQPSRSSSERRRAGPTICRATRGARSSSPGSTPASIF